MKEIVKKSFLLGLGAATLTKKQADDIIKNLVKRNKVTIREGKELLSKINKAANGERRRVSKFIAQEAKRAAGNLSVAPKSQIEKVKKKLKSIDKELSSRGKKTLKEILKQLSK